MRPQEINHINEALLVLRHFIDLSAKLLPFLEELNRKDVLTQEEQSNKSKIIEVYQNYEFDTNTSRLLLDSNILELIKETFDAMISTKRRQHRPMRNFLREHRRLKENWYFAEAN
jgi:hypothetical protein